MANFGKYAIVDPVKHTFEQEPDWWWMIKPPTAAAELAVARIMSQDRVRMDTDGTRINQLPTTLEIAMREVAVTFGGTNIPTSETDPTPVLRANASIGEVEDLLKAMPRAMLLELWSAIGEACPGWGPSKPRAPKQEGETKN